MYDRAVRRRIVAQRLFLRWLGVGAVCLATFACSGGSEIGERISIAVIPKGTTHEFWKSVHAGAVKASRELDVDIFWQGPLKEDDREEQIKVVDSFKARRVSGIALAPLDEKALRIPVRNAVRAGIPVLVFDSALDSEDIISFVSTDNYQGGRVGGEHLARILEGEGKVVLLRMQEGSASTMKREQGFLDAIAEHDGIEVVSSNQYGGVTTETAFRASENLLSALGAATGGVDGIFCPNESTTFGMLRALEDAKLAGKVKLVGFDSSSQLVDAMRDGELQGLVLQDPFNMGYLAVKMLVEHLRGASIEKRVDTGLLLVTPENMDAPDVERLLLPDLDAYLK
jgi:ribose transport system substrate-binding protein